MSFLLSEGHVSARRYPLGMMWTEVRIAQARTHGVIAANAVGFQMAAAALLDKKGGAAFKKWLESMTDGTAS